MHHLKKGRNEASAWVRLGEGSEIEDAVDVACRDINKVARFQLPQVMNVIFARVWTHVDVREVQLPRRCQGYAFGEYPAEGLLSSDPLRSGAGFGECDVSVAADRVTPATPDHDDESLRTIRSYAHAERRSVVP